MLMRHAAEITARTLTGQRVHAEEQPHACNSRRALLLPLVARGTQGRALGNVIGGALSQSKLSMNGFGSSSRSDHTCSAKDSESVRNVICRRGWQRAIRAAPRMIFIV